MDVPAHAIIIVLAHVNMHATGYVLTIALILVTPPAKAVEAIVQAHVDMDAKLCHTKI